MYWPLLEIEFLANEILVVIACASKVLESWVAVVAVVDDCVVVVAVVGVVVSGVVVDDDDEFAVGVNVGDDFAVLDELTFLPVIL